MSLVNRLMQSLGQDAQRAMAMREFERRMPARGRIHSIERSRFTDYYDKRFGAFEPQLDGWEMGHAMALKANPQLRRIDIVADSLFHSGGFELRSAGPVPCGRSGQDLEDLAAAISIWDGSGKMAAMLTLDIGSEIRHSKLKVCTREGRKLLLRLSTLDMGLALIEKPDKDAPAATANTRAPEGSPILQTLAEAIQEIRQRLGIDTIR